MFRNVRRVGITFTLAALALICAQATGFTQTDLLKLGYLPRGTVIHELGDEHSTHFSNGDGTIRAVIRASVVHPQNEHSTDVIVRLVSGLNGFSELAWLGGPGETMVGSQYTSVKHTNNSTHGIALGRYYYAAMGFTILERGWVRWDISSIPSGQTINAVSCSSHNFYVSGTVTGVRMRHMRLDPQPTGEVLLFSDALDGTEYGTYTPVGGWNVVAFNQAARESLYQARLRQTWFAVGYTATGSGNIWEIKFSGGAHAESPRLVVDYGAGVVDVQAIAIDAPTGTIPWNLPVAPQARFRNNGTAAVTFNAWFRIGSWRNQKQVTGLPSGQTATVTFDNWPADSPGTFETKCSVEFVAGDTSRRNDTLIRSVTVLKTDAEAVQVLAPTGTIPWNSIVTPRIRVRNSGSAAVLIPARLYIPGTGYDQIATTPVQVQPNETYDLSFPDWTASTPGSYTVRCSTRLVGDQVTANDTAKADVTVRKLDAECVSIDAPIGTVRRGEAVQPRATVKNSGSVESSFDVRFSINTAPGYSSMRTTQTLAPGATEQLAFDNWTPGVVGEFEMKCTTALSGDMYAGNDIKVMPVFVQYLDVGVVSITAPQGNYDEGSVITPFAAWQNYGNQTAGFEAWMLISDPTADARVYSKKADVSGLGPGKDTTVSFPLCTLDVVGNWLVRCSTYYEPDMDPRNDMMDDDFRVRAVGPSWPAGWHEVASMPPQQSSKPVKDGGWLAIGEDATDGKKVIYAAKGNKTTDFYRYDPLAGANGAWVELAPIPEMEGGKRKPPSKGCVGVYGDGSVYMTRGSNTLGFWRYDVGKDSWYRLADVPTGAGKKVKGGNDLAYVKQQHQDGYAYLSKGQNTEFYRYNTRTGAWDTLAPAPYGGGRAKYDKGSFIVYRRKGQSEHRLYLHQAKFNDGANHFMFCFDVVGDTWEKATLKGLPVFGNEGGKVKKKKSKDGAAGAWNDGCIYALKGGNTQSFFKYNPDRDTWVELENIPDLGSTETRKRVKNGADFVYFDFGGFFALKGNKTREMWRYVEPVLCASRIAHNDRDGIAGDSRLQHADGRWQIVPNPVSAGFAAVRFEAAMAGQSVTVTIFDIAGRPVLRQAYSVAPDAYSTTLDCRRLSSGVYLVRLDADGLTQPQKLVIQKQ